MRTPAIAFLSTAALGLTAAAAPRVRVMLPDGVKGGEWDPNGIRQ